MPPEEMKDKVCIITGGGGSIGLASARRMYDAGARIMLVDLNEDNLAIAKASFDDKNRVSVCTADVSVSAETKHYIAKTEKIGVRLMCYLRMRDLVALVHQPPTTLKIFLIKSWPLMSGVPSSPANTLYLK